MSKREQILIVGAIGAVLFGLYAVLASSSAAGPSVADQARLAKLKAFAADVDLQIEIRKLNRFEAMVLKLSGNQWTHDPFHRGRLPGEETQEDEKEATAEAEPVQAAAPQLKVAYTGYLATGPRRLAIVDGVHYGEGDELIMAPFTVEKIAPDKVTLVSKTGDVRLEVPIKE